MLFKLLNEAEYRLKNYGDRGAAEVDNASEISIIIQMIRRTNSIIVLLFIQNNSWFENNQNMLTSIDSSSSSVVHVNRQV